MPDTDRSRSRFVDTGWWRSVTAVVVAIVGTATLLLVAEQLPSVVNGWTPTTTGHLTRRVSYDRFNTIWLVVRAGLGLYISFVFCIVAAQLVGHWRRYVVDGGAEQ